MITIFIFLISFFILNCYFSSCNSQDIFSSEYSSTKNCKIKKQSAKDGSEGSFFESQCPSMNGYQISLVGDDGRSWLTFKKGSFQISTVDLDNPSFTFVNIEEGKIEWRYKLIDGKKQLNAIIYRLAIYHSGDEKDKQYLNIIRVKDKEWCSLGMREDNEKARALADSNTDCSLNKK